MPHWPLAQPEHVGQLERHMRTLKECMDRCERFYGPYPYKTITLADPPAGSQAYGMEYPTFFTGESTWDAPRGYLERPEYTIEHEYGHQYWYGMVATNEFEDAWMDEGVNSYSDIKVMDSIFGPDTSWVNWWGVTAGIHGRLRTFYLPMPDLDPMARNGWQYANSWSYGAISYGKSAMVLLTLEGILGEDTMRQAMHTYFMRYRFTHPTKEDFLKTIEEVSGKDLRWYFNQAVYGTEVLDYDVFKVTNYPADWYKGEIQETQGNTEYISTVWIRRKENFVMPIEIEIRFDNDDKVREHWDGQNRWVRYEYRKKAKVASVEIDPDHKVWLDRNNFNNSFVTEANTAPARKLVNYWTFVTQFFAQFLAWWLV